jgi:BMFP domain-containing protein YqiC
VKEFEAVKDMAARRDENDRLLARIIAALEGMMRTGDHKP